MTLCTGMCRSHLSVQMPTVLRCERQRDRETARHRDSETETDRETGRGKESHRVAMSRLAMCCLLVTALLSPILDVRLLRRSLHVSTFRRANRTSLSSGIALVEEPRTTSIKTFFRSPSSFFDGTWGSLLQGLHQRASENNVQR
jgi:hypothetical protein